MDAVLNQFSRWVGDKQMRASPFIRIDNGVVYRSEKTSIGQDDGHTAKFGCDGFPHQRAVRWGCPSTFGLKSGLLATVLVSLEGWAEFLSALALVAQTTSTLASAGLATVNSTRVSTTRDPTEMLVVLNRRVLRIDENTFVELVLSIFPNPV